MKGASGWELVELGARGTPAGGCYSRANGTTRAKIVEARLVKTTEAIRERMKNKVAAEAKAIGQPAPAFTATTLDARKSRCLQLQGAEGEK